MSDHERALALLPAWELGLLDEEHEEFVRSHLAGCAACRAAAPPSAPTDDGEEREPPSFDHLPPAMIASWPKAQSRLRGIERRLVVEHLERCEACRNDLRFLGFSPELPVAETTSAPRPREFRPAWAQDLRARLATLVSLEPLPVRFARVPANSEDVASRVRALETYARAGYEESQALFARAAAFSPNDGELLLYQGSAALLSGHDEEAIALLSRALALASLERVREEALFLLANAALLVGDAAGASDRLEDLIAIDGDRRLDAEDLLRRLLEIDTPAG